MAGGGTMTTAIIAVALLVLLRATRSLCLRAAIYYAPPPVYYARPSTAITRPPVAYGYYAPRYVQLRVSTTWLR